MTLPTVPAGIKSRVRQRVIECIGLVQQARQNCITTTPLYSVPEIKYTIRGRTAGKCRHYHLTGECVLLFNPVLLLQDPDDFICQTVGHEVAHYCARRIYGRGIRPHGAEWQQVMKWMGLKADRCHTYDTSQCQQRKIDKYAYTCACPDGYVFSHRRHAQAMDALRERQIHRYSCPTCSKNLIFSHVISA